MIDIPLGEEIKRASIHDRYGGNRQIGICKIAAESTLLLFSTPSRGKEHGYADGWEADGCYHYSGEGRTGDQTMTQRNLEILRHREDGNRLLLLRCERRSFVTCLGEFELESTNPWYTVHGPDSQGSIRRRIVFRLRPTEAALPQRPPFIPEPSRGPLVNYIPREQHKVLHVPVKPKDTGHEAERREAALLTRYWDHLEARGHEVWAHEIVPPGETFPLRTDLFDATDNVLVEAKGNVTREAIRMAVGQLFDYRRHMRPQPRLAVLVPDRPRSDLLDFCAAVNIATIWATGESFTTRDPETS